MVNIKNIILDKSKKDHAKERTKQNAHQKHFDKTEKINCIGVKGRHDKDTLLYKEIVEADGKKQLKKTKKTEHHLTFTKEMG